MLLLTLLLILLHAMHKNYIQIVWMARLIALAPHRLQQQLPSNRRIFMPMGPEPKTAAQT